MSSFARGLAVIRAFGTAQPSLTLAEVAARTGLTRASARRFLRTLQSIGYVDCTGRYFRLQPKTLELGYSYLASLPWWQSAQHVIEKLAKEVGRVCSASVLDGSDIIYVAHAIPLGSSMLSRSVGTRLPIFASAMGRAMLAHSSAADQEDYLRRVQFHPITPHTVTDAVVFRDRLSECRKQGFAVIDQELEIGLRTIAVPVLDRTGRTAAAIGLSVHRPLPSIGDTISEFLPRLRAAAASIAESIPT